MDKNKKQKPIKNHTVEFTNKGLFFGRIVWDSKPANKETATAKKVVNIIYLFNLIRTYGYENVNVEKFCKETEISMSNYRRILAIVKKHLDIYDEKGNSVANTPANKRYLTILNLYENMKDCGVDRLAFCKEHNISRSTFFRYLSFIDNYNIHYDVGEYELIAIGEDGFYYVTMPGL